MAIPRSLAGPKAFWHVGRRYLGAVGLWSYLVWQRFSRLSHREGRTEPFPIDQKGNRIRLRMVDRKRVSLEALQKCFDELPKEWAGQNSELQSFAVSAAVVRGLLGERWFNRHVMPNSRNYGIFTINDSSFKAFESSMFRIIDLAELLFNLQHVHGFDECIDRLRSGDLEGTYAELDLGRMLYLNRAAFRYVIPTQRIGHDYDVEIIYDNGLTVCGDSKCKIESAAFSNSTIKTTLDRARSQLPKDKPGIVFVKFPPQWKEIANCEDLLFSAARSFLRTTRRVVSVKYYVSDLVYADGYMGIQ